ncbi:MAG: hypothetical protein HQ474_11955 [Flammeovirgaceae bacterium]|jgi:hypothetical protein|nr:hypothetical protein [Flammeovirgaceae bacterium]|tara:strand:- start:18465 stop:19307 length:843 start_codon:yes stop_codon:yes gene_type:complete
MRTFNLFIIICASHFISSCNEENEIIIEQRVEELSLFDVANSGDYQDFRISFILSNIGSISSYRIILIPEDKINTIDKLQAFLLSPERYTERPINTEEYYLSDITHELDSEGNPIIPDKNYIAKILLIGENFNQLSISNSNTVSLSDQGVLIGYYKGILRQNITSNGFGQMRLLMVSGTIKENNEIGSYNGSFALESPSTSNFNNPTISTGSLRFYYSDSKISELEGSGGFSDYMIGYQNCKDQNSGTFKGELTTDLKIEITGINCDDGIFELVLNRAIE